MSGVVSGLILAAGTSSRLGEQTKQLLPWQDTTMLGWVVRRAEASLLDEVVVVVGHEAEAIRRHVALQRARFVEAPDFHEGCTSSIRAGLEALHPQSEAVVLILGDQPGIEIRDHRGCRRGVATHADADCARLVSRSLRASDALCQGAVRTTQGTPWGQGRYGSSVMRIPSGCTRSRSTSPILAMSTPGRITPELTSASPA